MALCDRGWIEDHLSPAERLWLFLDYDGTLADFAPTPEHVNPDPEVVDLVARLADHARFRVAVVSGRRLQHVDALVPVPDVLRAGTYGVELRTFAGQRIDRLDYQAVRPNLDALKPRWADLIVDREGFFLEDKGWSLALHARFAADGEARRTLAAARRLAADAASNEMFRVLGGHKFLEIGPRLAHKGRTIAYLLARYAWPRALPLYVGDDDKDEEAFGVIKSHGGLAVVVSEAPRETGADCRLSSPAAVRRWLGLLCDRFNSDI